jgi:hypothetical protein
VAGYEGRVEFGCYIVVGDEVILTDERGIPIDRFRLCRKLPPGADAKVVACRLVRQQHSGGPGGDFNRRIIYPKLKY